MRIAIVYRGHFKRGSKDNRANIKRKTNSFTGEILENNMKNLSTNGNKIDYYYHTYCYPVTSLSSNDGLLKIFESKGIKIKKYSLGHGNGMVYKPIAYSVLESLKLIEEDYDLIICLRFDLLFKRKIEFVADKVNFAFKDLENQWKQDRKVSDLFFSFPGKYLNIMKDSLLKKMKTGDSGVHYIYDEIEKEIGSDKINFLTEGFHTSCTERAENPLVKILR
jgi:hypothetical protein